MAEPSTFQRIIDAIAGITNTASSINTARLNGAERINARLADLRAAIVALRAKAEQLRDAILALQEIDDPSVLDQRHRDALEAHQRELNQIQEGLNGLQTQVATKAREVAQAEDSETQAASAAIADIDGLLAEIQAANDALDTITRDIVNLRRITGAAGAAPPPPRPAAPAAPAAPAPAPVLPPVPDGLVGDAGAAIAGLPRVPLATAVLPAVQGLRLNVQQRPSRNAAQAHNERVERNMRGQPSAADLGVPLQDDEKFIIEIPAIGGTRRRHRGGYTYPRTRTHKRPTKKRKSREEEEDKKKKRKNRKGTRKNSRKRRRRKSKRRSRRRSGGSYRQLVSLQKMREMSKLNTSR